MRTSQSEVRFLTLETAREPLLETLPHWSMHRLIALMVRYSTLTVDSQRWKN